MAKLTAWLVTIIGALMILERLGLGQLKGFNEWIIPIAVLVIGIGKLSRNYGMKVSAAKRR